MSIDLLLILNAQLVHQWSVDKAILMPMFVLEDSSTVSKYIRFKTTVYLWALLPLEYGPLSMENSMAN